MKPFAALLCLAAMTLIPGCATVRQSAAPSAPRDWPALFAEYGSKPGAASSVDRTKLETIFSENAAECANAASMTIGNAHSTAEQFSGAADAAGFLRAGECIPALEAGLRGNDSWFRRFACANAIDSIDAPSSGQAVLSALDGETNGMVAMALAMYLARHPSDAAQKLLVRKEAEFAAKTDDAALVARVFIEDALEAGMKPPEPMSADAKREK